MTIHLHGIGCWSRVRLRLLAYSCTGKTRTLGMTTDFKCRRELCFVMFPNASAVGQTMHVTTVGLQTSVILLCHMWYKSRELLPIEWWCCIRNRCGGKSVIAYRSVQYFIILCRRLCRSLEQRDARSLYKLLRDTLCRDVTPSNLVGIHRRLSGTLCWHFYPEDRTSHCLRQLLRKRRFGMWPLFPPSRAWL